MEADTALDREHLALLLRVGEILGSSLDRQRLLDALMDQVIEVLKAERGFILVRDEVGAPWRLASARAIEAEALDGEAFRISRGVVERVAAGGVAVLTNDAVQDERLRHQASVALFDLKSILCVPVVIEGRVLAVIYADHLVETGVFTQREKALLESIARLAAVALENAMLYERLQRAHEGGMEQARRDLARTQAQLLQTSKMAAVGQLAAGVAHEINNPLGAVALNVSALRQSVTGEADRRRLDLVERAVDRCRAIIDKLLRFSRAPSSASERFDLGPVARDTLAIVDLDLERAGVHRAVTIDDGLWVEGDSGEVAQAVMNVLINARDALGQLPEGAPRRLGVRAFRERDQVMLEVADSGPGIDAATRDRIFEPFFTTKDVGRGVGLGLSITYEILKRHGARVEVGGQPGRGTVFRMAFPAKE